MEKQNQNDASRVITKSEAIRRFFDGDQIQVVEYRGSKATWGHKREVNGEKAAKFPILKHSVDTKTAAFPVSEDLRGVEGFDPDTYQAPFTRGEFVVLVFDQIKKDKAYNTEAFGKLYRLVDDAPAKSKV